MSHFLWWGLRETFSWERPPLSCEDFLDIAMKDQKKFVVGMTWEIFGAAAWSIWLARNDLVFNKKVVSSPLN